MAARETFVIVGAGLAGAKAAEALRAEGYDGEIVLIGEEPELPYERPPLSKGYLRGESERSEARVHDEAFYVQSDVELMLGVRATGIDPEARVVQLAGRPGVRFDRLLLATGAEPRRLPIEGGGLAGVHYLRTLAQADALRAELTPGARLVVIGGGWIGAEVAASARALGVEVAIVEPAPTLLSAALGPELGGVYTQLHSDHGVELFTGAAPKQVHGSARVSAVELGDGRMLDADVVLIGIGAEPRVQLAEEAGLLVENGVIASNRLESSVEGIYVAGDVASAHHPFYRRRVRVEHWANALNQPAVAAKAMLGKPAVYERLPYFYSDQYDVGMEFVGEIAGCDEVVFRGDPASREFVAFWLSQSRLVAAMNVNVWDVGDDVKRLIRSGVPLERSDLEDAELPLSDVGLQLSSASKP